MTKLTGDLKKLQGSWTITQMEVEGVKYPFAGSKIIVDGGSFTTVSMGGDYGGTVEVNSAAKPKTFDLLFTTGPHAGKKSLGIYELKGDTWKICMGFAGVKNRPEEFATKPGTGFALETLKRESVADATAEAKTESSSATELEGEWAMVSGSVDGQPMQAGMIKTGRRVTTGDQLTVLFGKQAVIKARLKLDPKKSPKHIDYILAGGDAQLGVYKLVGSQLTVCMASVGEPRPADFNASKGSHRTLTVWKPVE